MTLYKSSDKNILILIDAYFTLYPLSHYEQFIDFKIFERKQ